jgi:hypothetical protein
MYGRASGARDVVHELTASAVRARKAVLDFLARIDPNTDPDADGLTPLPLLAFAAALGVSAWMFLRWKYQPMQDFGHHVALAAVVSDYGRPHSLYTSLYSPMDPFGANSLMPQVAGHLGRLIGVTTADRVCILLAYILGFPLAMLYALRVFGRSPWGAVLAVPLTYNMNYVAGFGNLLFAAPIGILAIVFFYRALDAPSWKRTVGVAITLTLLFLAHAHMFLWIGFLLFLMTLGFMGYDLSRSGASLRERAHAVGVRAIAAIGAVLPSILLVGRWYWHAFEEQQSFGHPEGATAGWKDHFGATFYGVRGGLDILSAVMQLFEGKNRDVGFDDLLWLSVAVAVCVALSRLHRYRKPPVLELAFGLTALSYFVLPGGLKGHYMVGHRQIPIAQWLLPAMASPLPAQVSRIGRALAIGLILFVTTRMLLTWYDSLVNFETNEVAGLDWVMKAAPPRLRIHYVKLDPGSEYFHWLSLAHVEKIYMGDGLGSSADTPGILSTSPIHFRPGLNVHFITNHSPDWPNNMEIWQNFDLVLTRRWHPSPALMEAAKSHGELLRKKGDWELWRSKEAIPFEGAP